MGSKAQRLTFLMILLGLMSVGFWLAYTFSQNLDGYATPADLLDRDLEVGQNISVGGLVLQGSLMAISEPLGSQFVVGDGVTEILVIRAGNLPDLFEEGELTEVQGTITNLSPLTMNATKVLAKHDQYYVPVSAQEALDEIKGQGNL